VSLAKNTPSVGMRKWLADNRPRQTGRGPSYEKPRLRTLPETISQTLRYNLPSLKHAPSIDVKTSFEKVYWKLKQNLSEDLYDLAVSTFNLWH